jgi:hypothetical protein
MKWLRRYLDERSPRSRPSRRSYGVSNSDTTTRGGRITASEVFGMKRLSDQ